MTIPIPEPVAWITRTKIIGPDYGKESFGKLPVQSLNPLTYEHEPLITTTQAEAYADARVRQVLEKLEQACVDADYLSEVDRAIRALIPPLPGPASQ